MNDHLHFTCTRCAGNYQNLRQSPSKTQCLYHCGNLKKYTPTRTEFVHVSDLSNSLKSVNIPLLAFHPPCVSIPLTIITLQLSVIYPNARWCTMGLTQENPPSPAMLSYVDSKANNVQPTYRLIKPGHLVSRWNNVTLTQDSDWRLSVEGEWEPWQLTGLVDNRYSL